MKEKTKNSVRNVVLSGLFIALGIVIPIAFHTIPDAGKVFLPMFLPVLVGALFLPWQYALAVGVFTPLLSTLLTGMPPVAPLPMTFMMAAELGVAAVILALMKNIKFIQNKKYMVVIALIPALIVGFAVSGLVLKLAVEFFGVTGPGMWTYVIGAVVAALPGIAILVVLVPLIYTLIKKRNI